MSLNPAAFSKINWTNIVAAGATLLSVFGLDFSPEMQVQIVTGIALVSQLLTMVFRTFFTGTAK
jgi:mannose/fructose/N-acetylgalactosamine-specific phosphotransferase system component IIC